MDNLLIENTWRLEYDEWFDELRKREREESFDNFDFKNPPKYDWFYDDNCWGEINGTLAIQYFDLLQELKNVSQVLYEKYGNQAIAILKSFSFFYTTREEYMKYRKENPNEH